jgi:colanic acid/amylovoran biosynthesis glycosyltransferase
MVNRRTFLYLIVSDYPYGFGEPFLEEELTVIAPKFEKIYIILPEPFRASKSAPKFCVPANAEIIELQIVHGAGNKLKAISKWTSEAWQMERNAIKKRYQQKIDILHLKVMLAYQAGASAFYDAMIGLIKEHNHEMGQAVIYSYWFTSQTLGMALLKKQFPELRAVTRIHGWDCFYEVNQGDYLPFRPFAAKYLDGIHPISEAGANYTKRKLADPFAKVSAYKLGIGQLPIPSIPLKKSGKLRILSLAFITSVKRIDRIIEAIALTKGCEIEWTHIGNAPHNSTSIMDLAYERLKSLPHVRYHFAGEMSKKQVYAFLNAGHADILLCTSRSEGIPVSMMEALGHGLPIISVDVGGISEIVQDGVNGELMPANSTPAEIAAVLEKWAELHESEFELLSNKAYSSYLQYFSALKNYNLFNNEVLKV